MELDQQLIDAAIAQVDRRWPGSGRGVAAAVYLDDGEIITSVALDNLNAAATLCAETGALTQAYTLNKAVTASVCVTKDTSAVDVGILAPCGICQERLALWGSGVHVAVADSTSPAGWVTKTLAELNP